MLIFEEIGFLNWKFNYQQKLMALTALAVMLIGINFILFSNYSQATAITTSVENSFDIACNTNQNPPLTIKSYIQL